MINVKLMLSYSYHAFYDTVYESFWNLLVFPAHILLLSTNNVNFKNLTHSWMKNLLSFVLKSYLCKQHTPCTHHCFISMSLCLSEQIHINTAPFEKYISINRYTHIHMSIYILNSRTEIVCCTQMNTIINND